MKVFLVTMMLTLLSACQTTPSSADKEERYTVRLVKYFGVDGRLPQNRVFLCGDTLFHSAVELVQVIESIDPPRKASFYIENVGTCDAQDAEFRAAEIALIVEACERKGFECHLRREKPKAPQRNAGRRPFSR